MEGCLGASFAAQGGGRRPSLYRPHARPSSHALASVAPCLRPSSLRSGSASIRFYCAPVPFRFESHLSSQRRIRDDGLFLCSSLACLHPTIFASPRTHLATKI